VKQQSLLASALSSISNAIFITDRRGNIVWANEAFCFLSGYSSEELQGRSVAILKSGKQDTNFYRDLWRTIIAGKVWQGEVVERKRDGTLFTVEETVTPLLDKTGNITHFIAIQRIITSPKQERERDHFLAYHDSLTGLPNRAHFLNLMKQSIEYARQQHKHLALLFVDLDRFKPVNDALGHRIGDLLLGAVADRLRSAVRKTDTVARIGGDEFTVIEVGLDKPQSARALARKLVQAIRRPYMINRHKIRIGASVGISIYPENGSDPETLLDKADAAMYRAKNENKGHYSS